MRQAVSCNAGHEQEANNKTSYFIASAPTLLLVNGDLFGHLGLSTEYQGTLVYISLVFCSQIGISAI